MNVLVVGSGGREHALVWKISQSPLIKKLYCAPGNPGTAEMAENLDIKVSDHAALKNFVQENSIDLTVVGPEDPLVEGIVDLFRGAGLKIFGPTASAARLEGSKAFSKELMSKYNIPSGRYRNFTSSRDALEYLVTCETFPQVVKASGLAAGKGVLICPDRQSAIDAVNDLMDKRIFGDAGDTVVIEEFLEGEEVSIFVLTDGDDYHLLASSQDHKKVFDDDKGKNTGGMGAYAPAPVADNALIQLIEKTVIKPTLSAMKAEGCPYTGILYVGLILTAAGPRVLEYNCRFGDPETEVVLPMLSSDLVPLMLATIDGSLAEQKIKVNPGFAVDVVLASGGYPEQYQKGLPIKGIDDLDTDILVFHAGTAREKGQLVTAGGRVLNIVVTGKDFAETRRKAYDNINRLYFEKMHFRKDIGNRAFKYMAETK